MVELKGKTEEPSLPVNAQLEQYGLKRQELIREISQGALEDQDGQDAAKIYKKMELPADEIQRRVARQYADRHKILFPVENGPLAENECTVSVVQRIGFEPVDYCLGIVLEDHRGVAFGAHILADDPQDMIQSEKEAQDYLEQQRKLFDIDPEKITFVSSKLGVTKQHRDIMSTFEAAYPRAKISTKVSPTLEIE